MGLNEQIKKVLETPPPPSAEESLNDINLKVSTTSEQETTNELLQEQIDNSPLTNAELRASPVPITGTVTATDLDIRDLSQNTDAVAIYGSDDGGTTKRIIKTDAGGAIQVDLEVTSVTVSNGAGAAAVNIQDGGNSITVDGTVTANTGLSQPLTNAELRAGAIDVNIAGAVTANNNITEINSNPINTGTGAAGTGTARVAVSSDSEINAKQQGTWNINNVSGTVSLPTGAATSANQTSGGQKTQIYQEGADVGKNNGAWMKFSNDSFTKSASGALLVNTPSILFDGKTLNADDTTLLWQNVGTGTFSWANNMLGMSVTAGQYCIRQSRRRMPYFSGYPVLAELTFDNFDIQANGTKRLGYFSSSAVAPHTANLDGFWLEMDGTTYRMISYNNGTETTNIPFTSFTNYATLSAYNFDNFTAVMFSFLWLGGAYLAMWMCTSTDGWILANITPYIGLNKGTICKSPNQPVRYELRSSTGTLDFRPICSQVSVGGNIEKLGFSLPSIGTAAIACNTVGTIYALQGFKKNSTYNDIAVKIVAIGCVNAATTDTGVLMVIRNPTLSAPLTYAAYGKIDRAIATNQTVTAGTGDIITLAASGTASGANAQLDDNYKAWMTQTITNTYDEYVLCYLSASANQDVRGYAILKEY